jgi:titin
MFVKQLENVSVHAGERVVLEAHIKGIPCPEIIWRHDSRPVKESHDVRTTFDGYRATLCIAEASPNSSGSYTAVARNRAGEAVSSCTVTVRGKLAVETSDSEMMSDRELSRPRFVQELRTITVPEGAPARLDCVIVGVPEPEVIWFKEETPIRESADFQLLFVGDRCSLNLRSTMLHHSGMYKCVARNSVGETTSFCRLIVQRRSSLWKALPECVYPL